MPPIGTTSRELYLYVDISNICLFRGGQLIMPIFILVPLFADSNKTISDVLTEFQDGGCLAQYDQNGVSVSASVCVTYYSIIG